MNRAVLTRQIRRCSTSQSVILQVRSRRTGSSIKRQGAKGGRRKPERVRVYEKIHTGIWSYNGVFHLVDSWREQDEYRSVFKFRLVAVEGDEDFSVAPSTNPTRRRVIPTAVKLAVWKRDGGKCVLCGADDELHFDHDLPWSKGGTSLTEANVQLLCARHNLQKHDRIV
jgi:hypothetical protein